MIQKFKSWLLHREGSGFVIDTGDPEDARHIPKVSVDDGEPVGGDPLFKKKGNDCRRCRKRSKKK
jgi:hypothetical protein